MATYLGDIFLKYVFHNQQTPTPPTAYMALHTDTGEVIGGGYARVPVTGMFSQPDDDDKVTNIARIEFPTPTSSWGTVTKIVLYDSIIGGNTLLGGALAAAVNVPAGAPVYWSVGSVILGVAVRQS